MIKCLILFLLIICSRILPQFDPGSRQIALSHSDVAVNKDVFALFNNPAGLSQIKDREIGIFYSPAPFGIDKLANGYLAYTEPSAIGNFSLGAKIFGFDLYKENTLIVSYSNNISENILFGISALYNNVEIKRYGSSGQFNFSFGGIFKFDHNLSFGFSLHNLLRYSDSNVSLPAQYTFGVSFEPATHTNLNAALFKEINFPYSFRFGIEHRLVKIFYLRIGAQTEPNLYSGGIGIKYSFINLNYSACSHLELGITHELDLILDLD